MKIDYQFLPETDSTNRWLKDYEAANVEEVVVCWTDYQTAGRGCGANTWESERGKNLLFSVLVHPTFLDAGSQFVISMMMANAICQQLSALLPTESISVKWPNDIYVGDQKICGILIENHLRGRNIADSVLGVGVNVNQTAFVSDAPNPVSLAQLMGHEVERLPLLETIVESFCKDLKQLEANASHVEAVRSNYLARLYRREGFHAYRDEQDDFEAELMTVETDGHLVLRDKEGKTRRYAFKEVQFVL
ncbi:MAG: biotin--[Prevotella sp.]|nr:biotin--[acetyl-CoA-carboxylase] ligase [Prevotella sp.]